VTGDGLSRQRRSGGGCRRDPATDLTGFSPSPITPAVGRIRRGSAQFTGQSFPDPEEAGKAADDQFIDTPADPPRPCAKIDGMPTTPYAEGRSTIADAAPRAQALISDAYPVHTRPGLALLWA
jgi:hypothetical protein